MSNLNKFLTLGLTSFSLMPCYQDPNPTNSIEEILSSKWEKIMDGNVNLLNREFKKRMNNNLNYLLEANEDYSLPDFLVIQKGENKQFIDFVSFEERSNYVSSIKINYNLALKGRGEQRKKGDYFRFVYPLIELGEEPNFYDSPEMAEKDAKLNEKSGFLNLERMFTSFAIDEAYDLGADGVSISVSEPKINFNYTRNVLGDRYFYNYSGTPEITFYFKD